MAVLTSCTGDIFEYLAKAAELGDLLIIGLNTDESVRKLKGPPGLISMKIPVALILASWVLCRLWFFSMKKHPIS